jgi:hypothetical protein
VQVIHYSSTQMSGKSARPKAAEKRPPKASGVGGIADGQLAGPQSVGGGRNINDLAVPGDRDLRKATLCVAPPKAASLFCFFAAEGGVPRQRPRRKGAVGAQTGVSRRCELTGQVKLWTLDGKTPAEVNLSTFGSSTHFFLIVLGELLN